MTSPSSYPTINGQRLWSNIIETAQYGATPKGGLTRLTLGAEDIQARNWFRERCEALGCQVSVDQLGNMFALKPGRNAALQPIAIGSHLDTQPTGGRFDGILGVLAGLEALQTLQDQQIETTAPLLLINWTNEEGSRFAPAMLCSGVYAGVFDRDYAYSRTDRAGITFEQALRDSGYMGSDPIGKQRFAAMFELHIEQGPILEDRDIPIGVVQGAQAVRWYEVTLEGRRAHTGTTPMHLRKNALLGASRVVELVNAIALDHGPLAVGTVGLMEVRPNSRNVIPGTVFFCVDLRHPEDAVLAQMEAAFTSRLHGICSDIGLTHDLQTVWDSPAVKFNANCVAAVREGARAAGLETLDITSGAGHDAVYVARVAPTTMIFVKSVDGLSHNEAEYTAPEDCIAGAQVLLNAVLAYDAAHH
ncbi:allantoate amidohydrolase [Aquipseudomonas campi]